MAALISKPGITNASVLAIPKTWDGTWFRSFVNSQLTGADVRNAVGANGIVVSGTLASPYATISLGGTGPITLTNNVTITPASGNALIVNQPTGGNAIVSNGNLVVNNAAGTTIYFEVEPGSTPEISARGPTAGVLVDMTPDRGTFTLTGTGFAAGTTSTATWYRIGNVVVLNIGTLQGTSNATTFTATGLPAAITPNLTQTQPCFDMLDNGAGTVAAAQFSSGSGTITFQKSFGVTTAWTNAGTKGVNNSGGTTLVYQLN
jgi:hypothetical protein